jgi:hypothetical protein
MNGGNAGTPPAEHRRLAGVAEVGAYDALYVAAYEGDAILSCAARLLWEGSRGLRILVVTVFGNADAPLSSADHLSLGLPDVDHREPPYEPWNPPVPRPDDETLILKATALLEDVVRRAKPRHLYVPLGIGGHVDRLLVHEVALRTFQAGRDLFFYEERPEAFVTGSVRIRLGEMGARLPPAAPRVEGEGSLVRFLLRLQTVPRFHGVVRGLSRRMRYTRLATRRWRDARLWRPQKALGPRLQPILYAADPSQVESVRALVRATAARFGSRRVARVLRLASDRARRLGGRGHVERYWLLLPLREDEARALLSLTEPSSLS